MCGRFVQVWDAALGRFVQVYLPTWKEEETILKDIQRRGYNVAPTHHVGAIVHHSGSNHLVAPRWGFRITMKGAQGQPVATEVVNTRIEDAFAKPLWRGLLGKSHAVVPAQGFYEWTGPRKAREPHFIERADGTPMLLAAVLGHFGPEGSREACVSIVTCGPNDFMRPIHDRMPVILEPDAVDAWLRPQGVDQVLDLAQPTGAPLRERPVSDRVNAVAADDPDLLRPAPSRQGRLF